MRYLGLLLIVFISFNLHAQDEPERTSGFRKENLFTGGGISLGFSNNSFQAGASPVLGYNIASWVDAGIAVNYNYASFRDVYLVNDKLRESTYGGGIFAKLYPLPFLFVHSQFEHNFTTQKYLPGNGEPSEKNKVEANSLLLGLGYAGDRSPDSGRPFFYISLLFDVLNSDYSPYATSDGRILPILRGGVQVPLFQGRGRMR
jgi:hypothetical protein